MTALLTSGGRVVAGSNPVTPTTRKSGQISLLAAFFVKGGMTYHCDKVK